MSFYILNIALSVRRFTASDYPFGIFKCFLSVYIYKHLKQFIQYALHSNTILLDALSTEAALFVIKKSLEKKVSKVYYVLPRN